MIMHKRIAPHDDERHEFVVTYEGPTHPSTTTSHSSCSNRQSFGITLPPTGIDTSTGSSYVSNDDLLSSLSKKIGWPAFLLCIVQQERNNNYDGASSPANNKLLFPTHSLQTTTNTFNAVNNIIYHQHAPITITISPSHTSIRGGKGGFGTLLKGQSKQAGARQTLDFGACRDLSGRRLRHVNDEIKLRKWKELQAARAKAARDGNNSDGGGVDELAALKTPSGIRNWHLMVPSWSDAASFSNKGKRKIERQYEREVRQWQSKEDRMKHAREQKRLDEEWAVMEYVRRGEEEGKRVMGGNGDVGKESVKEGILAHLRKKKLEQQLKNDGEKKSELDKGTAASASASVENNPAGFLDDTNGENSLAANLMTLSGEMSVFDVLDSNKKASSTDEDQSSTKLRIQSQSDFATAVVLLNADKLKEMSTNNGVYIECTIQTAGLAQIGWIRSPEGSSVTFLPNSDTGDGVGDDTASYGYDGSRGLKFHGGEEVVYGSPPAWKSGDVLGCWCILTSEKGIEIGYSLNGADLGVAFTVANTGDKFSYYPAISLNLDEIVDVNVGPHFAHGVKEGCVGGCELVKAEANVDCEAGKDSNDVSSENVISKPNVDDDNAPPRKRPREALTSQSETNKEVKPSNIQNSGEQPSKQSEGKEETFDLNKCSSVNELKEMDPDRLKNILLQMGVKCG